MTSRINALLAEREQLKLRCYALEAELRQARTTLVAVHSYLVDPESHPHVRRITDVLKAKEPTT